MADSGDAAEGPSLGPIEKHAAVELQGVQLIRQRSGGDGGEAGVRDGGGIAEARRGWRRDPKPRGKGQGGRRRRRGLLAANDDWSERAEARMNGSRRKCRSVFTFPGEPAVSHKSCHWCQASTLKTRRKLI